MLWMILMLWFWFYAWKDDIDLDDTEDKPKEQSILFATLNKQKLSSSFKALKGKFKLIDLLKIQGCSWWHVGFWTALLNQQSNFYFFSLSGRFKQTKIKNEKSSSNTKEEQKDGQTDAVDQIKKRYGFSSSGVSIQHRRCNLSIMSHIL